MKVAHGHVTSYNGNNSNNNQQSSQSRQVNRYQNKNYNATNHAQAASVNVPANLSSSASRQPKQQSQSGQPGPRHTCHYPGCTRNYSRLDKLKDHIRTHEGQLRHSCSYPGCEYKTNDKSRLTRHLKGVHLGVKTEQCDVQGCNFVGATKWSVQKHKINRHQVGKFPCPIDGCGKVFKWDTNSNLTWPVLTSLYVRVTPLHQLIKDPMPLIWSIKQIKIPDISNLPGSAIQEMPTTPTTPPSLRVIHRQATIIVVPLHPHQINDLKHLQIHLTNIIAPRTNS